MLHTEFLQHAVELAREHSASGLNGPFGAVVVKDGVIISEGWNRVVELQDPTAHAEILAIREACSGLGTHKLQGCVLYASCEPCPMCLAAAYWARIDAIYFACGHEEAEKAGFDDSRIYKEINTNIINREIRMKQIDIAEAKEVFMRWKENIDRKEY